WPHPVPGSLHRRSPAGDARVLLDFLPSRTGRGSARRAPGRADADQVRFSPSAHVLSGVVIGSLIPVALIPPAFAVGRFPLSPADLATAVWSRAMGRPSGLPAAVETVIFNVRGPRVLAAVAVGAALAVAGAAYQGLFRNPLVSPDILGVSSGAALGAVLGIYSSLSVVAIQAL